jgi:hypothetical protein
MLATVDELSRHMQVSFATDATRATATAALEEASTAVETRCKRRFARVADDERTMRWRPAVVLPDPPVISVASFQVDSVETDVDIDDSGRYWPRASGDVITVTYTHGFDPIPADVKMIVLRVAARIVANPGQRTSYTGPDGLNYSTGADVGPRILTGDEMVALRRYTLNKAI